MEDYSNQELQDIYNAIGGCFERGQGLSVQSRHPIGFLMLSRETARRGLEIASGKMGQIVLRKAEEPYPVLK